MKKLLKNKYFNIFALITFTVLVLFFSLKDDFNSIVNNILTLNIWWFLLAIFFIFGYWFFRSLSVNTLTKELYPNYKLKDTFRLILLGQFFNGVTPFATGGQPFMIYELKKDGVKVTDGTNIIIEYSVVYQIAIVFLSIIALITNSIFNIFKNDSLLTNLITIGFIINILVVIVLFIAAFAKGAHKFLVNIGIKLLTKLKIVKDPIKTKENWEEKILQFNKSATKLIKNKKQFAKAIIYCFIGIISQYLIPLVILYSLGDFNSLNAGLSIITCVYVMLIGSFIPIPGGTGGIEYGFVKFFGNFITGPTLNTLMLLWRFVTYYLGLIIGGIVFNIKKKETKK